MRGSQVVSSEWWNSDAGTKFHTSDAWEAALSDCYLSWGLLKSVDRDFRARIRQRNLDSIRLVQCQCTPCSGQRANYHIQKDSEPHLGIQIIHEGTEHFSLGNEKVAAGPGALVIWSSSQATEFEVIEALHKSTVMIPLSIIENRLPRGASVRGGIIDSKNGIGALLYSHICTLTDQFSKLTAADAVAAKWATIELAATAAARLNHNTQHALMEYHLHRVQNYILENLQDGELSVEKIAQANRISVRYVHKLFSATQKTVSRWLLEQRLERCKSELSAKWDSRCVVKEVAFRWGFNDTAHFSRVFKNRYGLSPAEYWISAQKKILNFT